MQTQFFNKLQHALSKERLENYGKRDGANNATVLARYLRNMAVSESLYTSLQIAELALRNLVHRRLTDKYDENWFDQANLTPYQSDELDKARGKLRKNRKLETPGALVAEMNFGF